MSDASTPERGGTSLGILLREAREFRGESLEDAARVTRIGKNYLAALEEDSFDKLPSPAYVKGFLRVYGKHLGLSPDELIRRYEEGLASGPAEVQGEDEAGAAPVAVRAAAPNRNRWMIPLVLLVLVLVTATIIPQGEPPPPPPVTGQVPVKPLPTPQPVQAPLSSVTEPPLPVLLQAPAKPQETKAPEPAVSAPAVSGIVLKLKVNQDCWLNITIDGAVSQQYDLKAGDLIEWKGERFFSLDLGNAGGVEAELNGQALPSFGEAGKTAHVILPADYSEKQ
uniref:Helix-turn-helix domain-containing protein n=1 Tax=Geobacter metallireducens TaxID=28232 RepID=A0A831XMH1_GEOME